MTERSRSDLIAEWDHYERAPEQSLPPWSDRAYEHETTTPPTTEERS